MKSTLVNTLPKRVWALAVIATFTVAGMAIRPSSAQARQADGGGEANRLIGTWQATANVAEPQGFPSFPVLMTFHADGTMQQSRTSYIPAFGALETPHYGAWKRISETQFAVTDLALVQGAPGNAALNGAFFGTEKVNFRPVLSSDGNSFTAQWTSTVYDPDGNTILESNGTLSGVRIQVEP